MATDWIFDRVDGRFGPRNECLRVGFASQPILDLCYELDLVHFANKGAVLEGGRISAKYPEP